MKQRLLPLLFLSLVMFSGCDDFLECIIDRRPEIHKTTFSDGRVDIYYYHEVTVEIKNETRDNDYDYYFEIGGQLPDGLEMFVNYRTVSFEGTPEVSGTYRFTLFLYVDPLFNNGGDCDCEEFLCSDSTSREFTITIN
ncbi:hypothetical protein [uncultured Psychroserpens sp.]|uniref:hypothetical protein n=1 Tax=uncultured Psychroserpens sp. TaxID=255436 RepID=UPI00260C1D62|nr:hypothetical protein [uncultured Psychroserpens sp.]